MVNIDGLISKTNQLFLLDRNNFTFDKPLSYKKIHNGYITPNNRDSNNRLVIGVFDENKIHIPSTGMQDIDNCGTIKKLEAINKPTYTNETVVFVGAFSGIWGHFITDSIRMLWFYNNQKFKDLKKYKMCYIGWANFKLNGPFKSVLEHIGFDCDNLIEIKECTQFKEIIIPDSSLIHTTDSIRINNEYNNTIDTICKNSNNNNIAYGKVFLSTSKLRKKNSYGEKKLDSYFKKQGFKIIHPQNFSFDEQLSIYRNCEVLASTDGSAMHNSVFCKEKTKLIIIPRGNYCTWYQAAINYTKNFDCCYIDSSLSVFAQKDREWEGPFYFYISDNLRNYFNDGKKINIKKNFYDIKQYFDDSIYKKLPLSLDNENYINTFLNYYSLYIKSSLLKKISVRLKNVFRKV